MLILMTGLPGAQVRFEAEVCGKEVNALTNCKYRQGRGRRSGGEFGRGGRGQAEKSLNEFCVFQQVSAFRGNLPVSLSSGPPPLGIPRKCPHFSVFKGTPLSVCVCVCVPQVQAGFTDNHKKEQVAYFSRSSIVKKK